MPDVSHDIRPSEATAAEVKRRAVASRRAADALLREHPDAMVFAQSSEGHIVPVPKTLGFEDYPVLAGEGRTGLDLCVAEDRMTVVKAWVHVKSEAVAEARARLRSDPNIWRTVRMLDLRNTHGVILSFVWIDEPSPETAGREFEPPSSTTPRFCSRKQDREGNVIECDAAYLQMFGYATEQEVIGQPTFERVHPDDQARLIESWITMVATGRVQMSRVRVRRQDASWLWVDTTYHNYLTESDGYVLAECIDVSAEMAAQEALQDREELLRRLLEEMPDGLLQLDRERNVVYQNARLREILCVARVHTNMDGAGTNRAPELQLLLSALPEDARRAFYAVVDRALNEGARENVEMELTLPELESRHILAKVRPLTRESGEVTGVIASMQDVTDSARARRELEQRACFDALTGSLNRSSIIAALEVELAASSKPAVVYVDLDRFKGVNDTLGHAAGDEVLIQACQRMSGAMRENDDLGRIGGDEFLILLRDVGDLPTALRAAERISESIRGMYELSGGSLELCASIGVACAGEVVASAEELIELADTAMYRSKQQRHGAPVLA